MLITAAYVPFSYHAVSPLCYIVSYRAMVVNSLNINTVVLYLRLVGYLPADSLVPLDIFHLSLPSSLCFVSPLSSFLLSASPPHQVVRSTARLGNVPLLARL